MPKSRKTSVSRRRAGLQNKRLDVRRGTLNVAISTVDESRGGAAGTLRKRARTAPLQNPLSSILVQAENFAIGTANNFRASDDGIKKKATRAVFPANFAELAAFFALFISRRRFFGTRRTNRTSKIGRSFRVAASELVERFDDGEKRRIGEKRTIDKSGKNR